MEYEYERVVVAECVQCKATRHIRAGEVPNGEQPICTCGMPMVAIRAVSIPKPTRDIPITGKDES